MSRCQAIIRWLRLDWLGATRVRAYSQILLLVSILSFYISYKQVTGATGSDFLAFWSAGRLAVAGMAGKVYDIGATAAVQATLGRHDVFAFVNPPPFILFAVPLGLVGFIPAWVGWIASTWSAWLLASRRQDRTLSWPIAAFPGALVAGWHAQTGLLTGALMTWAANMLRSRPALAGVLIGTLVIKPQLALLFPVALIAGGYWRTVWAAAAAVAGWLLLTALLLGWGPLLNYPKSWQVSRFLMETGDTAFFLRQCTVYAAVRVAISPVAGVIAQIAATAGVAFATWRVWSGQAELNGKLAFLFAAIPLATPYLFNYDLPFLVFPIVWLIGMARSHPRGSWERPLLMCFYFAPLWTRAIALPLGANLGPWIELVMLAAVWRRLRPVRSTALRDPPVDCQT